MHNNSQIGFWIIMIVGIFLLAMLVLGQTLALIDYDFTVALGLQESAAAVTEMGVAVNKGFGVGDTLIYLPLLALGLVGLWRRTAWGILALSGAFAITAYWPVVCLSLLLFARGAPGFSFNDFAAYSLLLGSIAFYGLWGLWYLYNNRKLLAPE